MRDLVSFLELYGFVKPSVNVDSHPSTSQSPPLPLSAPSLGLSPATPTLNMDSSTRSLGSPNLPPRASSVHTVFALQASSALPAAKSPEPLPATVPQPKTASDANASSLTGSSPGTQTAIPNPPANSTPAPPDPTQTPPANSEASSPSQTNPVAEMAPNVLKTASSSSTPNSVVPPQEPPYLIDGDSSEQELIGITLAGLAIISLVALIFAIIRKNRKPQTDIFVRRYENGPRSFSMKSDGCYRQAHYMGRSTSSHPNPLRSPSINGSSYLFQGENGFHSGLAGSPAKRNSKFHSGLANSGVTENSKVHSSPADTAAMGNSRIYSGLVESGSVRNPNFHSVLPDSSPIGNSKLWFTFDELIDITDGFSPQNFLGEGGFGPVYKGQLLDGRDVAVKELKAGSGQGEREFKAEVEIISRVHHRHLVSLVGYCIAEQHRLLVYEYVPNRTLEHHLHGKGMPVLDWSKRVKIAIGAAKGLAYLHEDCHPRIIHRDIKSANILLDNSFEAQVADFGLAKPSVEAHTHISTRVMGTVGYLAPEYASSGKLTDRSDVFSFGVVLLELVTGRKPVDTSQPFGEESLVDWARPLLIHAVETRDLRELLDPKLGNNYVESEVFNMIEIAAVCLCHSAPKRPRMVQVVRALDSEGSMSDLSNRVKYSQSPGYGTGPYPTDMQRFRQTGFASGPYGPAYATSREYEPKFTGYSGQYHPREPPQRGPNPTKGKEYGFDYGTNGDFHFRETPQREYHFRESPHRPLRTSRVSEYSSDYGAGREFERRNYPQNGENHVRKAPPKPQKSRKGSSDYSSGYGTSREYDRKNAAHNEHLSREVPHRMDNVVMEAIHSNGRGSDRVSGVIPTNITASDRVAGVIPTINTTSDRFSGAIPATLMSSNRGPGVIPANIMSGRVDRR